MKKQLSSGKLASLVFSIIILCFAIVSLSSAVWQAPSGTPPTNNVPAPLNVGSIDQGKSGNLVVGTSDLTGVTFPGKTLRVTDTTAGPTMQFQYGSTNPEHWSVYSTATGDRLSFWAYNAGGFNDRLSILSGGNVGIGTTTPTAKLDVNGGALIEGTNKLSFNNIAESMYSGVNGELEIVNRGALNMYADTNNNDGATYPDFAFYTNVATPVSGNWTGAKMVILNNGNIGIGTSSPTEKLDVAGKVKMTGFQLGTSATNGYVLTADSTGTGTWQASIGSSLPSGTSGQTLRYNGSSWVANSFLYNNGSNVGINTSSPSYTFDVSGSARVTNGIGIGSAAPSTGYLNIKDSSSNYTGIAVENQASSGQSRIDFGYNSIDSGSRYGTIRYLNADDSFQFSSSGSGGLVFQASNTSSGDIKFNTLGSNEKMRISSAGNVGIGTTAPAQVLQVNNTATNAFVVTSGGKVGIGTTNPSSIFEIDGSSAQGMGGMTFNRVSSTYGPYINLGKGSPTATSKWLMQVDADGNDNGKLMFQDASGGNDLVILQNGSVGIGTTAPAAAAKLDIAGKIRIQGGSPQTGYVLMADDATGLAHWAPYILQGATGPQGPPGPQGPTTANPPCTYSSKTYSTGAMCMLGCSTTNCTVSGYSQSIMTCNASGLWVPSTQTGPGCSCLAMPGC